MSATKIVIPLVLLLVVAGAVSFYVYHFWFDMHYHEWISIPVDRENDLAIMGISPRRGDLRRYVVRRNEEKGIVWKTRLETFGYEVASFTEERFRRDVMLKDGAVSLLYAAENRLYKFNWETGEILSTLDVRLPSGQTAPWLFLQDRETLYLREAPSRDSMVVSAVNFDDFSLRWQTPDLKADLFSEWTMPFQNDRWLVQHRRTMEKGEILAVSKAAGELRQLKVDIPGFLKDDFYYFLDDNRDNPGLCRWDLKTGERENLYSLNDKLSRNELFETYPALWHDGENRLFTLCRENGRSFLKARELATGELLWSLPLPEHYIFSTRILTPTLQESAPEYSLFPEIKSRCLPLPLIDNRNDSAGDDSFRVKYWIVDLEEGKVVLESRGVEQNTLSYARSMEDGILFQNGKYHFMIPQPNAGNVSVMGVMTIDGESGEVEGVVLPGLHMPAGDMPMDDYNLKKSVSSTLPGRTFTFKDGTVLDLENRTLRGKESGNYYLEDITAEMEELYGF